MPFTSDILIHDNATLNQQWWNLHITNT